MWTAIVVVVALLAPALSIPLSRAAGRACIRIDRDAYRRAQNEWAVYRQWKEVIR